MGTKHMAALAIACGLILLLAGCINFGQGAHTEDTCVAGGLSTSQFNDTTGRHFEETPNGIVAAFFRKDEITGAHPTEWVNGRLPGEGYETLTRLDPEKWDMYVYYAPEQGFFGYYSFRFSVEGETLSIFVTPDPESATFLEEYLLIVVQPPIRSTLARETSLYVNGEAIPLRAAEGR